MTDKEALYFRNRIRELQDSCFQRSIPTHSRFLNADEQAVLQGMKPCMTGIILATGVYMILKNGIVMEGGSPLLRPLLLTPALGALYFGSRKIKKGGMNPILLICLSAAAGVLVYGV